MGSVVDRMVAAVGITLAVFAAPVDASVVVAGTRIIFPSQEREVTVRVTNEGEAPALVQAWLDKGDVNVSPDKIDVPFTLTPAIFRLDPQKGQAMRLIYSKQPLGQDRETLFWLNVLEIPPKPQAEASSPNMLQLAVRTRIKVFFRPNSLEGKSIEAPAKVVWELVSAGDGKKYQLKARNPTPFYVNLGSVILKAGDKQFDAGAGYIAPGESAEFPVEGMTVRPIAAAEVEYNAINDSGGGVVGKTQLSLTPMR